VLTGVDVAGDLAVGSQDRQAVREPTHVNCPVLTDPVRPITVFWSLSVRVGPYTGAEGRSDERRGDQ
jgi:hypothetical protein